MNSNKAGENLLLEIFYNGEPAFSVPEYAEIELRLSNQSAATLEDCTLKLSSEVIKRNLTLRPGAIWSIPFRIDDLVGQLQFVATSGEDQASTTLEVVPQKLGLDEVLYIKTERLPTLLSRLDAPNSFQLRYTDRDEREQLFNFFSADYTAEKLRYFSRAFLEDGLGQAILNRLDYLTPEQRKNDFELRGPVQWPNTIQNWLNRPAEAGLRHEWREAPRDFATLPNQLFIRFQIKLERELDRLVRFVEAGGPASARLQKELPQLKKRIEQHQELHGYQDYLSEAEIAAAWNYDEPPSLEQLAAECDRASYFNPAYRKLLELWRDFSSRYVSLPEDEQELARAGLQPMSKIYELWAVCEIAAALDLNFEEADDSEGLAAMEKESAVFSNRQIKLYYNKGVRGGWYSANRPGLPRPDVRLELVSGRQILLDVKYRVGREERARPDDMYKMLAYMHDFGVDVGGIIFPGQSGGARVLQVENPQKQRLLELALRPQPDNLAQFEQELRHVVTEKLNLYNTDEHR
jgi:hypothetical protein